MYYCFITNINSIALEMHTIAERNTKKNLIFDLRFLKILFKEWKTDTVYWWVLHASTPMLVKHSLDNKWSTVNESVQKFWSRQLSRVHRTLSVVCKLTKTAWGSTGVVRIWCSDIFLSKVKEGIMIMYRCVFCNASIRRTRYYDYNLCSVRYRYLFLFKRP